MLLRLLLLIYNICFATTGIIYIFLRLRVLLFRKLCR